VRAAFLLFAAGVSVVSGADAQEPDVVTLYGRAYGLLESVEVSGGSAPAIRLNRVTDQASLLGVRGKENLGGGLVCWLQLETGFAVDSPGTFGGRNSAIGLSGAWGTVLAGRWDSVYVQSQVDPIDPFGHQGLPDIAGAAINQGNYTRREKNVIQYWSPRLAGFRTKLHYTANEGRSESANPYDYAVNVSFENGGVYAAAAFEKHKDQLGGTTVAGVDEEGLGISGFREIGPLKISAQYGHYRRTGTVMQKSYMIGFRFKRGVQELLGTYQNSRDGGPTSLAVQPRCILVGFGYRYRFSPKTFFIAQYAHVDNMVGALCNFGTNPVAISEAQDLHGIAVGLRTVF
jgi:predicted porin